MGVGRKTVLDQIFIVKLRVHLETIYRQFSAESRTFLETFKLFLTSNPIKVYQRRYI